MSQDNIRVLFCTTCSKIILDNPENNAVFGVTPYPFDDGVGLCQKCASFNKSEKEKLSYDRRMARIRDILARGTATKIEGVLLDTFTASAIVNVHDALNGSNQRKFTSMPVRKMADIAWKLIDGWKEGRP